MATKPKEIIARIKDNDIEWVDLRFTDPKGKWQHLTMCAGVIDEDALDGSDIDVDVNAAVVTLKGTVASQAGSDRAAEVAKGIEGVKSVRNNLKVTARK